MKESVQVFAGSCKSEITALGMEVNMKESRHGFGKEKIFSLIVSLGILLVLGYGIYSVVTGVQNSEDNNIVNLNDSEKDNVAMRTEDVTDAVDDTETDKLEQANADAKKKSDENMYAEDAQYQNGADKAAEDISENATDAAGNVVAQKDEVAANGNAVSTDNAFNSSDIDSRIANAVAAYTFDENSSLSWPVVGEELLKYSMDSTIYFPSLGVYKCNPAILIGAKSGTNVGVAADGIVQSVNVNEETGNTIDVAVGGGYVTTYGLIEGVVVKKGDTVVKGQLLGQVSNPTAYYSKEGSGLYFKVTKDGEPVDPGMFLED